MKKDISVYIHWPFCKSKCPYCDFNSHVRETIEIDKWNQAYLIEIENNRENLLEKNIVSIFFGGGTPSLMPSFIISNIIDKLSNVANINEKTEITFEANPTSVESQKFKEFALAGINRVSLGVQSFNEDDLKFLGREHSLTEALEAIEIAKKNFKRYSFDLIYALPNQTLKAWENELKSALKFADKHLSLYQLTIEKGTPFYGLYKKKKFTIPNENLAKDFYDSTQDIMNNLSLPAYEISNHAAMGEECRHNMAYWQYDEFIGISLLFFSLRWRRRTTKNTLANVYIKRIVITRAIWANKNLDVRSYSFHLTKSFILRQKLVQYSHVCSVAVCSFESSKLQFFAKFDAHFSLWKLRVCC